METSIEVPHRIIIIFVSKKTWKVVSRSQIFYGRPLMSTFFPIFLRFWMEIPQFFYEQVVIRLVWMLQIQIVWFSFNGVSMYFLQVLVIGNQVYFVWYFSFNRWT